MVKRKNTARASAGVSEPQAQQPMSPETARRTMALLEAQDEATRNMLASQSAVVALLSSHDQEVAAILLEAQDEAARNLLASQSAVAALLSSHDAEGAALLLEAQDEAAGSLFASQYAVAALLSSHEAEGAAALLEGQDEADGEQEERELDMGPGPDCGLGRILHGRH